jgi:hypothetical protein
MISLGTFTYPNGTTEVFREITPTNYVEGPVMFKRQGKYYLMWSEGGWTGPDYAVAYGTADTPLGPFNRVAKILAQDPAVATGSGHNGVLNVPGTDIWYIVYHRRPLSETDQNHRVVCYDRIYFDENGAIQPVKMLVRDNFEDGQMIAWKTWTADGTEFVVQNGEMMSTAGEGGIDNIGGVALMDTNFTDLVYEADVTVLEDQLDNGKGEGAGLVFRAMQGGTEDMPWFTGYMVSISAAAGKLRLSRLVEAGPQLIGEADAVIELGKKYHIKVKAVGTKIEAYVEDVLLVTVSDAAEDQSGYTSGANGVAVDKARAAFDNIAIDKA